MHVVVHFTFTEHDGNVTAQGQGGGEAMMTISHFPSTIVEQDHHDWHFDTVPPDRSDERRCALGQLPKQEVIFARNVSKITRHVKCFDKIMWVHHLLNDHA
jgi:hypothetical protein